MRALALSIAIGSLALACEPPSGPPPISETWRSFVARGPVERELPDFSTAGYRMGEEPSAERAYVADVTDFGALPDDGIDDAAAFQRAADDAGAHGGGEVRVPAGRFDFNVSGSGPFVTIHGDGVVVRGAGSGPGGTELHLVHHVLDVRSDAVLFLRGDFHEEGVTLFSAPARRGDTIVEVESTASITSGELVRVVLSDGGVDPAALDPARATLAGMLTAPFPLTAAMTETIGEPGSVVPVTLRVAEVVDATHLRLSRPLRKDCPLELSPRIVRFDPIEEAGIERLRITTEWPGRYSHHHPYPRDATGDAIVRSTEEQDYLWTAIQISRASDCWVRDVVIADVSQGVMLYEADHVTIEGVVLEGTIGHVGIGLTRSFDNLVRHARFDTRFVHSVLAAVFASGNVVTSSEATVWGYDEYSTADSTIDHHGLFPYENLYDDLRGLYVVAGGPSERLPHAGVRNTFWNLEVPDRLEAHGAGDELFRTYATDRTSSGEPRTNHELWPESFVVGITRIGGRQVLVGGSTSDRDDEWLRVEHVGTRVLPRSLYCAQRAFARGLDPSACP